MKHFTEQQLETLSKFKRVEDRRYKHVAEKDAMIETRDFHSLDIPGERRKKLLELATKCKTLIASGALDRWHMEKMKLNQEAQRAKEARDGKEAKK